MASFVVPAKLGVIFPNGARRSSTSTCVSIRPRCASSHAPVKDDVDEDDGAIMCDPCGGKGWIVCDFCNGQKTNVKSASNRIFRRCPTCKAVGCVLCARCKVFKCVTFPNYDDAEKSNL